MQAADERKLPLPTSKKPSLADKYSLGQLTAQGSAMRGHLLEYGKEISKLLVPIFL